MQLSNSHAVPQAKRGNRPALFLDFTSAHVILFVHQLDQQHRRKRLPAVL